jgi:hypothetical protein
VPRWSRATLRRRGIDPFDGDTRRVLRDEGDPAIAEQFRIADAYEQPDTGQRW